MTPSPLPDDGLRDHEYCVPHDHVEPDPEKWERAQAAALASLPAREDDQLRSVGYRLDALLDEMVAAGWSGEFDARERAALGKLGWVPAREDEGLDRLLFDENTAWAAWERYNDEATRKGSGFTRDQMTGARAVLMWWAKSLRDEARYTARLSRAAPEVAREDACQHGYMTGRFCSECPGEVAEADLLPAAPAIEDEARAALLADLRERVEKLRVIASQYDFEEPPRHRRDFVDRAAILALLSEAQGGPADG